MTSKSFYEALNKYKKSFGFAVSLQLEMVEWVLRLQS